MAKTPQPSQPVGPEKLRTTVYRIVPHRTPEGLAVPEKWDMEEVVVEGIVVSKKIHERNQTLPAVRHRHQVLVQQWVNREGPETWKL